MKAKKSRRFALGGKVERALELPDGVLSDAAHLEISGRREVIVEGCHGIVSYDDDTVRLGTGSGVVRIAGEGLILRAMNDGTVQVSGQILSVDFADEER
ncbi:MAG: YabP/YqfC family sporulation protein [Acutalibacteraceae bacterium]|jgi:sporulation protein YqfC